MKGAELVGVLAMLSMPAPASGQLMLPGAIHAPPQAGAAKPPQGSGDASGADAGSGRHKPVRAQPPAEATIAGRTLARDGSQGAMAFESGVAEGLLITSLSLVGEDLSSPGAPCQVDVVAGAPIEARFSDRLGGLSRYEVAIAACPFSFELLDGAVLVARDPNACVFAAAGCRVDPTGLWGPRAGSIDARQIEQWERGRAQAEADMRATFRALLASAGKDPEAVKRIAGEQAGFSSERSMACASYAGEELHGFCALRLTEARVMALQARRAADVAEKTGRAAPRGSAVRKAAPLRAEPE